MLPPVLEVYAIWHPDDTRASEVANAIVEHFHGTPFLGLLGGCIEVFVRSQGWRSKDDSPRPIPQVASETCASGPAARFIAIVPLVGLGMARAVEKGGPWRDYCESWIAALRQRTGGMILLSCLLDEKATQGKLGKILGKPQMVAAPGLGAGNSVDVGDTCRDLAQALAQLLGPQDRQRLNVFISHTKRPSDEEEQAVADLVQLVRDVVGETRLGKFFDCNELQPGKDWDQTLREQAARSALLAVRTDLYSSRTWCQREVLIAKQSGMPMVVIDALKGGERRGSFLMDHVARVPVRMEMEKWRKADVVRALNLLVDASLAREIWVHQARLAQNLLGVAVAWWAPHAPEPITLIKWLEELFARNEVGALPESLIVLYPDPPLGDDECAVLSRIVKLSRLSQSLDLITPRQLASRII